MTVLAFLGVLVILATVTFSSIAVQDYSVKNFNYKPFNLGNLLFMIVPIGLFWGATLFQGPNETLIAALKQGDLDTILMVVLSALSLVVFTFHMTTKSNFWVAIFSIAVQFFAAVAIIAVILLVAMMRGKSNKMGKKFRS